MSKLKVLELSESQINHLVQTISEPTFKFMMRRVGKVIFEDPAYHGLGVNTFISILLNCMATTTAAEFNWIDIYMQKEIGEALDMEKARSLFTKRLYAALKIELQ